MNKLIEVNWRAAQLILTKVRAAMGHRDSLYRLSGTIELDIPLLEGNIKVREGDEYKVKRPYSLLVKIARRKQDLLL
ncbi:MAG: hypothetical protein ACJASU_000243 [Cognaticolwellia sp.]